MTETIIQRLGISRRNFMKFSSATAIAMGLDASFAPRLACAIHLYDPKGNKLIKVRTNV